MTGKSSIHLISSFSRSILTILFVLQLVCCISQDNVHAFYYLWYGIPSVDSQYSHWNHEILPHWREEVNARFPSIGQRFNPPNTIHSPYYPAVGPYSSKDNKVMLNHFAQLSAAGVGVIVVSWWGQRHHSHATDTQGVNTDIALELLLQTLDQFNAPFATPVLKLAIHLEPYPSRSAESIRSDIEYLITHYGHSRSIHKRNNLPMFYVYDSYHLPVDQWRRLLVASGDLSVRNTPFNGVFVGLWLDHGHGRDLWNGGFDGIYGYFAAEGFSYGSTLRNWPSMCSFARSHGMICSLSVGPGYNDSLIRPWNNHNSRARRNGEYYKDMWTAAIAAGADVVSITSFNEWGEGTQIEPAQCITLDGREYECYGEDPYLYLNLTADFVQRLHSPSQTTPDL